MITSQNEWEYWNFIPLLLHRLKVLIPQSTEIMELTKIQSPRGHDLSIPRMTAIIEWITVVHCLTCDVINDANFIVSYPASRWIEISMYFRAIISAMTVIIKLLCYISKVYRSRKFFQHINYFHKLR